MALFPGNRSVHQGLIAASDGVVMDERQVDHIQLVLDGTRVMGRPMIPQGGVDHGFADGLEPGYGREFAAWLAPPDVDEAMRLPNRITVRMQSLGRFGIAADGGDERAGPGYIVFEAMEGTLNANAHHLAGA